VPPNDAQNSSAGPTRLGRYEVVEKLGQGGMGEVYLAHDTELGRRVALKVLPQGSVHNPDALERFRREARALARLAHPGIVQAHDSDSADGRHFLVLEYVEGWSLSRVLREHGRVPPALAADYARQAALALQHAHEKGLVHRDLKPGNLLVTPQGQVKLLDLGLARFLQDHPGDPELTREGAGMGTPDYCAPEQFRDARTADARSDVYALGCTLYHLLTGQVPFPAPSLSDKARAHAEEEPAPLGALCPEVPVGLALVVRRMIAKRPQDRFQSAGQVAEALALYVPAGSPEAAALTTTATWDSGQLTLRESRARGRRRWRWAVAGAGALGACLLALLAWSLSGPGGEGNPQAGPKGAGPQGPPKGEAAPEDPDVLTVAQDGSGRFRTLAEALAKVTRPGMTVRILDAAVYPEALQLDQRGRHDGLTLEAPRRATLAAPPRARAALAVGHVADVTVRGLHVRAGKGGGAAVLAYGRAPGLLLDGLEVATPEDEMPDGIALEGLDLSDRDPPAVVRNCAVRAGSLVGIRVSGVLSYHVAHPCKRVVLRDNQVEGCRVGVHLVGALQKVQVVGNRVWNAAQVGLQLDNLLGGAQGILVANNTLLGCDQGLRLWDKEVRGKDVHVCNNLILGSRVVDMAFTDSGGNPVQEAGPGNGKAVRGRWRVEHNWREGPQPPEGAPLRKAWIPADPGDVLQGQIEVTSRTAGQAGFLRPRRGSPLGTRGAGKTDPALPPYVGALPPEGVEAWDWQRTWLAPPPGRLLTVSQSPEGGGQFRSLSAALARAEPWATIRVLDDATYEERVLLDDPRRHTGLALEAPRGATLEMRRGATIALEIRGVPHVCVKGFRFQAPRSRYDHIFIRVVGRAPGVTLEGLHLATGVPMHGIALDDVRSEPGEDPLVIRHCTVRVENTGVVVSGLTARGKGEGPSGGVAVVENRASGGLRGIVVQGGTGRVLVAGNLVWDCGQAGLQAEDLAPDTRQILLANNTVSDCACLFRLWNNDPADRPTAGQLECWGNLFVGARGSDLQAAVAGEGGPGKHAPALSREAAKVWRFAHNWRDLAGVHRTGTFPLSAQDGRLVDPKFVTRDPEKPGFMRPAAGQEWALQGASRREPSLPPYVGAVPPAGAAAWDWDVTWRARMRRPLPARK
jgi:hypothetical protein